MKIEYFLQRFIEGYLFDDLVSMATIKPKEGKTTGGVSYPILVSSLAGVELLGGILSEKGSIIESKKKSRDLEYAGEQSFLHYWEKYLCKINKNYSQFGRLLYQLMRHGLAHTFMVKHNIFIDKENRDHHLELDDDQSALRVNCNILAEDLIKSYEEYVKPLFIGRDDESVVMVKRMQDNLDSLLDFYEDDSENMFKKASLPKALVNPEFYSDIRVSGASGTAGPVDFTTCSGINN